MRLLELKPFIQSGGMCGPASIKMALSHWGYNFSEKRIAKLCGSSNKLGTTDKEMIVGLKKLGFDAVLKNNAYFKDIRVALKTGVPIVAWFSEDDSHYSVVVGINKKQIAIQDPNSGGVYFYNLKTFRNIWFGFESGFPDKSGLTIRSLIIITKKAQ
jgi:ABC-type bacteriocin/lantibiotic exporter with double-glycine peptidase domain